jgi:hypothetical protein
MKRSSFTRAGTRHRLESDRIDTGGWATGTDIACARPSAALSERAQRAPGSDAPQSRPVRQPPHAHRLHAVRPACAARVLRRRLAVPPCAEENVIHGAHEARVVDCRPEHGRLVLRIAGHARQRLGVRAPERQVVVHRLRSGTVRGGLRRKPSVRAPTFPSSASRGCSRRSGAAASAYVPRTSASTRASCPSIARRSSPAAAHVSAAASTSAARRSCLRMPADRW